MLLEFRVQNFRSIANEQVFSMVPAIGASNIHKIDSHQFPGALKVASIYGANGAGKSNFVIAMSYLAFLVSMSSRLSSTAGLPYEPFLLDDDFKDQPTRIEIVFAAEGRIWRYGFEVNAEDVVAEWLFARSFAPRSRERVLFERSHGEFRIVDGLKRYNELLKNQTNRNQLFLSKLDQNKDEITGPAFKWIDLYLRPVGNVVDFDRSITAKLCASEADRRAIIGFLRSVDVDVNEINIKEENREKTQDIKEFSAFLKDSPNSIWNVSDKTITRYDVSFIHRSRQGAGVEIEFSDESSGTQDLFAIAGPIIDSLNEGFTLIVDELNQTFHTHALAHIIALFQSDEANQGRAQLIFTSHDISIMETLERDEIWFAEKVNGATELFSTADFGTTRRGGTRRKQAFGKRYLEGRYGALPDTDLIRSIAALKLRHG